MFYRKILFEMLYISFLIFWNLVYCYLLYNKEVDWQVWRQKLEAMLNAQKNIFLNKIK